MTTSLLSLAPIAEASTVKDVRHYAAQTRLPERRDRSDSDVLKAVPKKIRAKVTLILSEEAKAEAHLLERMWMTCLALDLCIDEVSTKAGVYSGEWVGENASLFERIPGVVAVYFKTIEDADRVVPAPVPPSKLGRVERKPKASRQD